MSSVSFAIEHDAEPIEMAKALVGDYGAAAHAEAKIVLGAADCAELPKMIAFWSEVVLLLEPHR